MINNYQTKTNQPSFGINIKPVSMYKYMLLSKDALDVNSMSHFCVSESGIKTQGLNNCVGLVLINQKKNFIAHIHAGADLCKFEKGLDSFIDKNGFNSSSEALIVGGCEQENFGQAIINKIRNILKSKEIKTSELTDQKYEYSTSIYCNDKDVYICHANSNKDYSLEDHLNAEIKNKDDYNKIYSNINILKSRDKLCNP